MFIIAAAFALPINIRVFADMEEFFRYTIMQTAFVMRCLFFGFIFGEKVQCLKLMAIV